MAPWELEKRRIKEKANRIKHQKQLKSVYDVGDCISYGRSIGKKRKKKIIAQCEIATFACLKCGNNHREDLIRLRQDLFECRKCGHVFIKEEAVEEMDFDDFDI